jgi:hypothetical protein
MPDSWRVTGNLGWSTASPGATSLELASYCIADEGIDFDAGSLFRDSYAENPAFDGGRLAYTQSGVRHFRFPLRLASSWPGPNGLQGLEDHLRRIIRAPVGGLGYIDLLPEGAAIGGNPSAAVRFDILDGRVIQRTYSVYRQRIARRDVDLELDVQPFGYLPTVILLASAAEASGPLFSLTWNPASVIGDVPGKAILQMNASTASAFTGSSLTMGLDGLYWTTARVPGGSILWNPTALAMATAGIFGQGPFVSGATIRADAMSPMGQVLEIAVSPTAAATTPNLFNSGGAPGFRPLVIASPGDIPAYRGRFRILMWARTHPSHGIPWQITAEVKQGAVRGLDFLASHNPVATLTSQSPPTYSAWPNGPVQTNAASAFHLLDLGEHTIPAGPSGVGTPGVQSNVNIWFGCATVNMGVGTPFIDVGGIVLLPVGGDAGILANGMAWPTVGISNVTANTFTCDGVSRRMGVFSVQLPYASYFYNQIGDARSRHYGDYAAIGTQSELDFIPFQRMNGQSATSLALPITHQAQFINRAAVYYQPQFSFLRGL